MCEAKAPADDPAVSKQSLDLVGVRRRADVEVFRAAAEEKVTDAAAYDGGQLTSLLDKDNTASTVWADTAYRSKRNERHLARSGFFSKVHFRRKPGFDLTSSQAKANVARSKVRSAVEAVFAAQKHRFGLFVRTIGLARATVKIGLANLTYNMRRLVWIEQCKAPA